MSLKLFIVTDTMHPAAKPTEFFSDKKAAKQRRRELNEQNGSETRFVVSPGPDHHNFKG